MNILHNKKLKIQENMKHREMINEKIKKSKNTLVALTNQLKDLNSVYDWLSEIKCDSEEIRKYIIMDCDTHYGDIREMRLVFNKLNNIYDSLHEHGCFSEIKENDNVEQLIKEVISSIKYWHYHVYKNRKLDLEELIEEITTEIQALKEQLK